MNPDDPDLGLCCGCERRPAEHILMLNRRGPVPGQGWGCVVCGLPLDGALAVLCEECVSAAEEPRLVCVGYPKNGKRVPYAELSPELFDHDPSKHADD